MLTALAAPTLHVQSRDVLYTGPRTATHATVALDSRGQVRVDLGLQPIRGQRWSAVLFDEGDEWIARPHDGRMLSGPDDIWLRSLGAPMKRWRWEDRWVEVPGELSAVVYNAHVQADGRMQVYTPQGRLAEGKDHRFRRVGPGPENVRFWVKGEAFGWIDSAGLSGRFRIPAPLDRGVSWMGGVDSAGEGVLAWAEPDALYVRHRGGEARLAIGEAHAPVDPAQCLIKPCTSVWDTTQLVGDLVALGDWIGVPYERHHSTEQISCRERPPHPCDPAGPINTCPTEPQFDCTGPFDVVSSVHIAWVKGSVVESQAFPVKGMDISSAVVDSRGRIHLVGGTDRGIEYVRLGAEEGSVPARDVRLDPPGSVPLERDAMSWAGLIFQDRFQDARAPTPAWEKQAIRTGGEHGDGYWIAVNPWLNDDSMALEVDVEVEPLAGGCGDPWVGLWHAGREFGVVLSDPIQILANGAVLDTGVAAAGAHTIRVEVKDGVGTVAIDGKLSPVEIGEPSVYPGSTRYHSAEFGHRVGCGVFPYAKRSAATWSRVELH